MKTEKLLLAFVLVFFFASLAFSQVGINIDTPQATLHVAGNLCVDALPNAPRSAYVVGIDSSGFMQKIPNDSVLIMIGGNAVPTTTGTFPDVVGTGASIMTASTHRPPVSFYRGNNDKVMLSVTTGNTICMVQTENGFMQERDLRLDWPAVSASNLRVESSAVILGNYLYLMLCNYSNGDRRVYRYDRNNINAGGTQMGFVGTTLGPGPSNSFNLLTMTSNGTHFFFDRNLGNGGGGMRNAIAKCTLSGTNFVYVSTTTPGVPADFDRTFMVDAAGNYYAFSATNSRVTVFSPSGTLIKTGRVPGTHFLNWNNVFYGSYSTDDPAYYERWNK